MTEHNTCCRCGKTITGTPVMMDDDPLCERCAEEETILCSRCGERIYRDDNAGDENMPLCQHCYEDHYYSCDCCGRTIQQSDAYYADDDEDDEYQMLYEAGVDDVITFGKGVIDLVKVGVDTFFHMAELHPTHFYDFLRRTEEFFDAYIQAYCEQENVRFIGGKLRIDLASEKVLNLTADFYFYTPEETWSVQHKEGSLKVDALIDWEDNPDLAELRGEGYLEYPLEPPEISNPCK